MSPAHEAFVLPATFLTVVLIGGLRLDGGGGVAAPSLFALVLAMLLVGVLVQSGAVAPERLMRSSRSTLANLNGLAVLVSLLAASAQAVSVVLPASGLPAVMVATILLVVLGQMLASALDRVRLLRALAVTLAATFTVKFVVLAALSSPADSRIARALQVLFDNVTLGAISQPATSTGQGYAAFAALLLYLLGVWMLPAASWRTVRVRAAEGDALAGPGHGAIRDGEVVALDE